MNCLWAHSSNLLKILFTLAWKIIIWSCDNFAYATAAELSWYMQLCDLIGSLKLRLEHIIFVSFELSVLGCFWVGPRWHNNTWMMDLMKGSVKVFSPSSAPNHYWSQHWFIIYWTTVESIYLDFDWQYKYWLSRRCIWQCHQHVCYVNLLKLGNANIHQWDESSLLQIMAWCLTGAKPLPEPMLAYYHLDPWEQTSVKFQSKYNNFLSRKCNWNCRLLRGAMFVLPSMCEVLRVAYLMADSMQRHAFIGVSHTGLGHTGLA